MNSNKILLPVSVVIAGLVIAGAIIYQPGNRPAYTATTNTAAGTSAALPTVDDDAVLGNPNAPVTMLIFGDYQCPFCKQAFDDVETRIRTEYVDTGKVKMVYRDFPLDNIHPFARKAGEAAECAEEQGKYWQYHDALFEKQEQIPTLDFEKLAGELGLDVKTFSTCLTTGVMADEVAKDKADGEAAAINGTPATFIGNTLIPGAYPYETYKELIDAELEK